MVEIKKRAIQAKWVIGLILILQISLVNPSAAQSKSGNNISHLGRWLGFFMYYSGYQPSDAFNLQLLTDAFGLNLVNQASFNPELNYLLDEFQHQYFLHIYPVPVYNIQKNTFDRLNQISLEWHDPVNAPALNLFIYLDTLSSDQFRISLNLYTVQDTFNLAVINNLMNQTLKDQSFTELSQTIEPVNSAIMKGLEALKQSIGKTLLPDFMVAYQGQYFSQGQTIEVWQDEPVIEFTAINHHLEPVYAGWQGSGLTANGASAFFQPLSLGETPIKIFRGNDTLRLKVFTKPDQGIPSLKEVLQVMLMEALKEKKQSTTSELVALRKDSMQLSQDENQQQQVLNGLNPVFGQNNTLQFIRLDNTKGSRILSAGEVEDLKKHPEKGKLLDIFIQTYRNLYQINQHVLLEELLRAAINDPKVFNNLLDNLVKNSGRLLARFILKYPDPAQKAAVKKIITDYINQNIIVSIHETNQNTPVGPVTD
ncbi:MAG: hypothetical protein ACNS62_04810 [Candidatus Cyclobacteriaceae bacterium M3_2C_046]